jgi:hypothetical protein
MRSYQIQCACGETVTIEAPSQAQAIKRLASAMEQHLAGTDHDGVPKDLPREQRTAMVKARMKRA